MNDIGQFKKMVCWLACYHLTDFCYILKQILRLVKISYLLESPEINPGTYGHLIFHKGGKNIQWREDSLFNKWCWENWTATCKRMKLELPNITPYTNIRPETMKLLEENIGHSFLDINHAKILYDPPSRVMEIKIKINKWDLIKLKSFCTAKETMNKVETQPSEYENSK